MFLRTAPTDTLTTLMDSLDEPTEALSVNAADIRIAADNASVAVLKAYPGPGTGDMKGCA